MHYLDYAATTPVSQAVAQAMLPVLTEQFGNPSSQYALGRQAKQAVQEHRATIASALGCAPADLYFTSCGTESDNWAIRAALHANRHLGKHIITTAVEHSAVLELCKALEQTGYSVTYLKPDHAGKIDIEQVAQALRDDTALISCMAVNNELGNCYPIAAIAQLLQERHSGALLHTDAVQAFLKIPFTVACGADLISVSAHKIGAPKGVGALYVRPELKGKIPPSLFGGGQESALRSGTEATAQIAGFARAVELRHAQFDSITRHLREMQSYAKQRLEEVPTLQILGTPDAPHILACSLPGYPSANIVADLDSQGICISAGSACHKGKASHVFAALRLSRKETAGAFRVSFGPETCAEDIDALVEALKGHQVSRFPML